jgi:hypothetical protein
MDDVGVRGLRAAAVYNENDRVIVSAAGQIRDVHPVALLFYVNGDNVDATMSPSP